MCAPSMSADILHPGLILEVQLADNQEGTNCPGHDSTTRREERKTAMKLHGKPMLNVISSLRLEIVS
jgi:hypothetical protein